MRAARLRRRDRAGHRHAHPSRRASRTPGPRSAFVTAANDFGVYDLRYADKGSNLRSKGADGFTPARPADAVGARGLDPTALRIRTWVNGELVQEDTTADLLFPFDQLVADLSQLITLEIGRRHPHRHPRGGVRGAARAMSSRSRSTAPASAARHWHDSMSTDHAGHRAVDRRRRPAEGRRPAAGGCVRQPPIAGTGEHPHRRPQGEDQQRRHRDPQLPAAQARLQQHEHRRAVLHQTRDAPGRAGPHAALRAQPGRPLRHPWRRLQRPKTGLRRPEPRRRARHGLPRRTPAPARSATCSACAPRCAAPPASSPTAGCAMSRRSRRWTSPPTSAGRIRPCSAADTCPGTSTRPSPAAAPPCNRAT